MMRGQRRPTILSVLMPAYKATGTIGLAIASTLIAMPRHSELLIHLDGPGTSSRILEWAKHLSRVRVFESDNPLGISGAINSLIAESRGELIARMDADDVALPFRFGMAMRLIHSSKADLVFLNAILFGEGKFFPFLLPQLPFSLDNDDSKLMLGLVNPFVHPTLVARKSSILAAGGYRDCIAEDYDLWMRSQLAGLKLRRISQYGVLYRIHGAQYTRQQNFLQKQLEDKVFQATRQAYRSYLAKELEILDKDTELSAEIERQLRLRSFGYRLRNGILGWVFGIAAKMLRDVGPRNARLGSRGESVKGDE